MSLVGSDVKVLCAGIGQTSSLEARVSLFCWTSCSGNFMGCFVDSCGVWIRKTVGGVCQALLLRSSLGSSFTVEVLLLVLAQPFFAKPFLIMLLSLRVFASHFPPLSARGC